jgi:hypothetical protein
MAPDTLGLPCIQGSRAETASVIFVKSYRLQMRRIDTGARSAQMIERQPGRNLLFEDFICDPMGLVEMALEIKSSIASLSQGGDP